LQIGQNADCPKLSIVALAIPQADLFTAKESGADFEAASLSVKNRSGM
jgi:hypothetical protein